MGARFEVELVLLRLQRFHGVHTYQKSVATAGAFAAL
jgi:hypothetical protein